MDYPKIHLLNFRDVGGLKTKNGRRVKTGYIFRGSQPALDIDKETIEGIEELGLDGIYDLRDKSTIFNRENYNFPNIKYVNVSVLETIDKKYRNGELDFRSIDVTLWDYVNPTFKDYRNRYREFTKLYTEIPFSQDFNKIFEAMDRHEKMYIHCQGGKDRTGVLFFILLGALGVNEKEILKDYLLSNKVRVKKNRMRLRQGWEKSHKLFCVYFMRKLLVLRKKYYLMTMDSIKKYYGTFNKYLEEHFNITESRLQNWRDYYLE